MRRVFAATCVGFVWGWLRGFRWAVMHPGLPTVPKGWGPRLPANRAKVGRESPGGQWEPACLGGQKNDYWTVARFDKLNRVCERPPGSFVIEGPQARLRAASLADWLNRQ